MLIHGPATHLVLQDGPELLLEPLHQHPLHTASNFKSYQLGLSPPSRVFRVLSKPTDITLVRLSLLSWARPPPQPHSLHIAALITPVDTVVAKSDLQGLPRRCPVDVLLGYCTSSQFYYLNIFNLF